MYLFSLQRCRLSERIFMCDCTSVFVFVFKEQYSSYFTPTDTDVQQFLCFSFHILCFFFFLSLLSQLCKYISVSWSTTSSNLFENGGKKQKKQFYIILYGENHIFGCLCFLLSDSNQNVQWVGDSGLMNVLLWQIWK